MAMIMHQQDEIRSSQSERADLSFWVSRNKAYLALQSASLLLGFFLLLSLRVDLSVFSISFFSFNVGRTHMFILCNGIVAFLVKGSGEASKEEIKNVEVIQKSDDLSVGKLVGTEKAIVGIVEEEEIVGGSDFVVETEQIDLQLVEEESQEEEVQEESQEEREEEEEDGVEELSVEELNKKCDEFIRRMRGVISNGNNSSL